MAFPGSVGPCAIQSDKMVIWDGLWRGKRRLYLASAEGRRFEDTKLGITDDCAEKKWDREGRRVGKRMELKMNSRCQVEELRLCIK